MDKKPVVFYTNDLADTPKVKYGTADDPHTVSCVHGLATLWRWTGHSYRVKKSFKVPAPVVAYNLFMNCVNRADQMRSTNACRRKEKQLSLTVWHFFVDFFVDLCILNAFQVYLKLHRLGLIEVKEKNGDDVVMDRAMALRKFKRQLSVSLCAPYAESYRLPQASSCVSKAASKHGSRYKTSLVRRISTSAQSESRRAADLEAIDETPAGRSELTNATGVSSQNSFETNLSHHILQANPMNRGRCHRSTCYLCLTVGSGNNHPITSYGCVQCQQCFHPECFSLYHNSWKVPSYNTQCQKIHDRLQEFFTANLYVLEYNMEGDDRPTSEEIEEDSEKRKGICTKPADVKKFGGITE